MQWDVGMYGVAQELADICRPLLGHSPLHMWNTQDFLDHIKSIRLEEGEFITSCRAKALFTSVPVPPAIAIIKQKL